MSLTVRSERNLRKPSASGIFHIYGLCHEVGHLAMYLPIKDRSWMTIAAAEGWAHYLGSRIVDEAYKQLGSDLWPDRYNYLEDGTERLNRQISKQDQSVATVRGAEQWKELRAILDDRQIGDLFDKWGKAQVDPASPEEALKEALAESDKKEELLAWWKMAGPSSFPNGRQADSLLARPNRKSCPGRSRRLFVMTDLPQENKVSREARTASVLK